MDAVPLRLRTLCVLVLVCSAGAAQASSPEDKSTAPPNTVDGAALVQALRGGGHVIYFRHGKTDLTTRATDRTDLANCATQRRLSEEGRREMAEIGRLFVQMRIPVGTVLASPYCRAIDTARLAFGKVTVERELEHTVTADAATTRRRMNTAKVTSVSPWAATMRDVLVKYLSVWLPMGPAASAISTSLSRIFS